MSSAFTEPLRELIAVSLSMDYKALYLKREKIHPHF
jgi:hypothetical protein